MRQESAESFLQIDGVVRESVTQATMRGDAIRELAYGVTPIYKALGRMPTHVERIYAEQRTCVEVLTLLLKAKGGTG